MRRFFLSAFLAVSGAVSGLQAWDQAGHRMVNELALATLPADFPAFVRDPANLDRIGFLAAEPDRWSHAPDVVTKHMQWMEHYLDMEQIPAAGMDFAKLPSLRYEFAVQFAAARAAHAQNFPAIDPTKNRDQTRQWPGFLPWSITEQYGMLKAAFASLRVYEELGTPSEIANVRANIVYQMGIMGHMVGDGAQPLHTTDNYNGWVGANPNGYTTWTGFHSWIDGGLIAKARIETAAIAPRMKTAQTIGVAPRDDQRDPVFVAVVDYILAQHKFVEPLYKMEKAGQLGQGEGTIAPEARALIEGQLAKGGEMLGNLWLTAWRTSRPDTYLRGVLVKRQGGVETPAPATKK